MLDGFRVFGSDFIAASTPGCVSMGDIGCLVLSVFGSKIRGLSDFSVWLITRILARADCWGWAVRIRGMMVQTCLQDGIPGWRFAECGLLLAVRFSRHCTRCWMARLSAKVQCGIGYVDFERAFKTGYHYEFACYPVVERT
jgi:hypothetical protein